MTGTTTEELPEISDEAIYDHLRQYADAGLIDYVLPTDPIGEQWIIGWNGEILKFVTKEGIVGFLAGIRVYAGFAAKLRDPNMTVSIPALSALMRSAGCDPVDTAMRQNLLDLWPDPLGHWTAEQADAARAVKDGIRRILGEPEAENTW
jgi:hypothetical protein